MKVPAIVTIAEPQSCDTGNSSPLKSQLANESSLTSAQPNALWEAKEADTEDEDGF